MSHTEALTDIYLRPNLAELDASNISESKAIGSATVFSTVLNGKKLKFKYRDAHIVDSITSSIWDITGKCIEGSYKGKSLEPIIHSNHFAFAFLSFFPDCEIYDE